MVAPLRERELKQIFKQFFPLFRKVAPLRERELKRINDKIGITGGLVTPLRERELKHAAPYRRCAKSRRSLTGA